LLFGLGACVIDEDVEPAELFYGVVDDLLAEAFLADIALDEEAAAAVFLGDLLLYGLGVFAFVEVGDGYVGAFFSEEYGHGAADAAVAAGDDGYLVLEPVGGAGFIVDGLG